MEQNIVIDNQYIAAKLKEVAKQRQNRGETYPARAYNTAANLVAKHPTPITCYRDAYVIKGIGEKIAQAIDDIIKTGNLECLKNSSAQDKVLDLFTSIWGFGPAISKDLYDEDFRTIEDLRKAHEEKRFHFTPAQVIGLQHFEDFNLKMNRTDMEEILLLIKTVIQEFPTPLNSLTSEIVGSYRRGGVESKDVDILVWPSESINVSRVCYMIRDSLLGLNDGEETMVQILACGEVQLFLALKLNEHWRRIDIFVAKKEEYACAMLAHTGSKNFNVKLRDLAIKKGWLLNEKGLFNGAGERIETETEEEIQALLGLEPLKPSQRN
jgi:DNA polymerase/3'-5' exonuclease PolX